MSYVIKIVEVTKKSKRIKGDWVVVKREYVSADDYANMDYGDRSKYKKVSDAQDNNTQYVHEEFGYTPDQDILENVEIETYKQTVETLDIVAVIQAVNKQTDSAKS